MKDKASDAVYKKQMGRTICEVHREIYDELYENFKDHPAYEMIAAKLQESYTMAKKMDAKLRQYKHNYDEDWWEKEKSEVINLKLARRNNR